MPSPAAPAFGQADLSNCEREQIHLPGSIQPHGALLVCQEPGLEIIQSSANIQQFLKLEKPITGTSIDEVPGDLASRMRAHLDDPLDMIASNFHCTIGDGASAVTCEGLQHRAADGSLIVELMPSSAVIDLSGLVQDALQKIPGAPSLDILCQQAAATFFELTGYDRVMVYRFDDDGHGQVLAEKFEKEIEPYLGNRYPASDIPQIARRLYLRNRIRMLVDVNYQPVALEPRLSPLTGRDLDMSMCFLRSSSPIHVQYLKNMGVAATLVVSLVVGGKLWGLVACHHYSARIIPHGVCAACELLAESFSTRIAAFDGHAQTQVDWSVRRFEARMIESMAKYGDWKEALFNGSQHILTPLDASGAALFIDNEVFTTGEVPGSHKLREIERWLMAQPHHTLIQTASLGDENPDFAILKQVASGLVAVPISNSPGDFLVWFRPEQVRTDTWGGNPAKAFVMGDDPMDLSPRRSFAKWHQQVEGTSSPWTPATLNVAMRIGQTIADTVLHFRSVRALIAEDQLNKVIRQVGRSDQPVIITDASRKILLANEAFQQLLPPGQPHLDRLEDLPGLFGNPSEFRRHLTDLCDHQRPWRGEVSLRQNLTESIPLLLRGDPVLVSPQRVLGYVFMFTSLAEQKAVEAARQRFQEGIVMQNRRLGLQLSRQEDLVHRNLITSVVGNAQLAALEITDGVDITQIPEMLESVQASVNRSAELLKHLMWYAESAQDEQERE